MLVQAGGVEALIDQIRAFAARAGEVDAPVELVVYDEMVHVWHLMRGLVPEAQHAIDAAGAFIRDRTP